ncbi:MAG: proline--tRNA ligase [Fastidiosipilaceae bacterium]|jgi:prolyl-tRNA synthetase
MRLSESYFYTLREDVKDEDSVSGNLLVRAGMIKKSSSGVYMLLPLGLKAYRKIETIIREEMDAIGSQELTMPALIPEEVYVRSGRRESFGDSMFSLKDRFNRPFVLGPTHEELFAAAAGMAINSYKDLPVSLYQFQTKYRDEPRPRFGLIRVREFVMKDAYSFDKDLEGLDHSYKKMFDAYHRAFDRMGLRYVVVRADTGVMGGLLSEEFQAVSEIGEDILVLHEPSGYAANLEVANCIPSGEPSTEKHLPFEEMPTPNAKTIEEVAAFLDLPAEKFVKTLIYVIDGEPHALLVRGDHEINEAKVLKLLNKSEIEMADATLVREVTDAPVGFAGPIGIDIPVIMDTEVSLMANFIVGANQLDRHFVNVNLEDFKSDVVADIRQIKEGDMCENGAGPVSFKRGIEVGNTFKLGEKYARAMDLFYTDADNVQHPVIMGSYGIGPARCLAAVVEQHNDGKRILWPKEIAPIEVAIVPVNVKNEDQVAVAEQLYQELMATGHDVLLDDRNERAGIKFNDMELIGAYCRITVGRTVTEGKVELKVIGREEAELLPIAEAAERIRQLLA